jgi:hypothetical protein
MPWGLPIGLDVDLDGVCDGKAKAVEVVFPDGVDDWELVLAGRVCMAHSRPSRGMCQQI